MAINDRLRHVTQRARRQAGAVRAELSKAADQPTAVRRALRYAENITPPTTTGTAQAPGALQKYFETHGDGPGIWKWLHYFDIYERHFAKFRGQEVHVAEVGIYSGGSMPMWLEYFGADCRVYGIDIEPACKGYERPGIDVFIGDQADPAFWAEFRAAVPRLDILIDDGGHEPHQQIVTLEETLPHIQPGGVYFCEDIQGPRNVFHTYVDALTRPLSSFIGQGPIEPTPFQQHVESVHRYTQVVVIEKPLGPVPPYVAPRHGTQWQPWL
jgi:hypothetical protein